MKIFCIGLSRTGTYSLHEALKILGYSSFHWMPVEKVLDYAEKYDAISDTPVSYKFKELDKKYPNAKFIYTCRDMETWLDSCEAFWKRWWIGFTGFYIRKMHRKLYKCEAKFDRKSFKKGRREFEDEVFNYFKGREEDLLILNIVEGDGWEKLCSFLNKPVPNIPFPHVNKKGDKEKGLVN